MPETTLPDRALIRLSGEDVRGFLDGLVTNALDVLPVYAALLTPQGKVIADFIVWGDGDDLLLDVASGDAEALERRLAMYRLRRAITIERDEALAVHWSIYSDGGDGADDPRLPALGRRWIAPLNAPAEGWLEHRLRLGVAEGAAELGDLLWLECNAAELNGVSFSKGCFVGQENTARMNWRGKVNRRLFVVPSGVAPEARMRVEHPDLGLAVAHLRVDEVPPRQSARHGLRSMPDVAPTEQIIIVTGRGIEADDGLAATRIIGRAEIERSASGRVEDVLRDVAGLASFRRSDSRSAHPTSQGLTLRGLGGNAASRVTLMLDGVPQADPFGGWIAFSSLDPHAIDRIRVVRGGGIEAVAGTIVIDSRAPDENIDATLLGGSRQSIDARALGGLRWGNGFASLSGSFARGDGFVPTVAADRGTADRRAPYRQGAVRARLVQNIGGEIEAQANISAYRDERDRGTDFTDNRQRGTDASLRLVGKGATRWSALAYVQDRRFDSQFASVTADRGAASLALDQRVPARGYGLQVEAAPKLGQVETRIGAEWRRVSGETDEQFRFIGGAPTRQREAGGRSITAGLFAGAAWSAGGWSLAAEGRADHWTMAGGRLFERELTGEVLTDNRFADRTGWEGSGRVAAGRRLSETLALRAAAYRGWRLPTLNELYRPFRVGPDATAANAALDPERLDGIEAGLDWTPAAGARLSATAYANRLEGAIANVSLGVGPGLFPGVGFVAAGGTYRQRQNVEAIVSRGLEIDATWALGPWRAAMSYALTDARIEADGAAIALGGKRPAQVARHSGSASLGWDNDRLAFDATARLTGRQFEDDNNDRALPAALTFDGTARIALARNLGVEARVENLFDRKVIATISGNDTRERALPRTIWLGLRIGSR